MLNDEVRETSLEAGYVISKYRESRDELGELSYLAGSQRKEAIRGVPAYNVATDSIEAF